MSKVIKRWLDALTIAKILFEYEGYHINYLNQIESYLKEVNNMALKSIGALWRRESKKGEFLTGMLDLGILGQVQIGIFQNEKGEGDEKKPDARIVLFDNIKTDE